ncbi:hypothetical protein CU098_009147 [Rhizopus stolonifer]|uniref:Lem3/Cdc50 n=1 Tax=Rhizopus stolonifer TaxID=4846 RepID=A0A367J7H0_RHIST|nr:hypothetical protein CU098_009147 [Rhizopus stolonifer]
MINYTTCEKYTDPIYLDSTLYRSRFSNDTAPEPPTFYYKNTDSFLDSSWGNPNNLTIKRCVIDFTVPETMQGPVIMYYRLTGFYQNRKQYISNYDISQLGGQAVDQSSLKSNCDPLVTSSTNLIYYPCGLIANSMFNGRKERKKESIKLIYTEKISLDTASDLTSVTTAATSYAFDRSNIAWPSDKQKYKPTTYPTSAIAPPMNWADRYPNGTYTQEYPPPDVSTMERLMVWMHVAALPDFRKIWARNNNENLNADRWRINIDLSKQETNLKSR